MSTSPLISNRLPADLRVHRKILLSLYFLFIWLYMATVVSRFQYVSLFRSSGLRIADELGLPGAARRRLCGSASATCGCGRRGPAFRRPDSAPPGWARTAAAPASTGPTFAPRPAGSAPAPTSSSAARAATPPARPKRFKCHLVLVFSTWFQRIDENRVTLYISNDQTSSRKRVNDQLRWL